MPSTACVVINCDSTYTDKVTRRHRFPKDTIRFNIWVQRSGNNKLLNKTINDVYKSYVMCDKHFEPCFKSLGLHKLNANAVPTLNLPGMIEMFNVDNESDSANAVCLMNVSTVSSVMDISVNEVNVDNESDSANAVCLMNVSTYRFFCHGHQCQQRRGPK
uniref:THAP-type domain-containing protein n=1 Tax=Schizaphis graminum TaxID=13262 RepID=A0A2S2PC87_SCHGA